MTARAALRYAPVDLSLTELAALSAEVRADGPSGWTRKDDLIQIGWFVLALFAIGAFLVMAVPK